MALLCVLICIGLSPTIPLLMCSVLMLGITASCFDVGVNAVATTLEKTTGKSSLSTLHAFGGGGGLAGAALGSLMAGAKIPPATHFMAVAAPLALALWLGYSLLEVDEHGGPIHQKAFSFPRGPVVFLGALGFFGALPEGGIADWSGVFLKDNFGVGDGIAPLALSAFSAMVLMARLHGDKLNTRLGARPLVTCGAALATTGLLLAVFAPTAVVAIGGFAIAGLGPLVVFPFVFSAAGKEGPAALTSVATMTYTGTLMGPPMVGSLTNYFGVQVAMGFVAMFSMTIAIIAHRSMMLK
jgi:MFS family permease